MTKNIASVLIAGLALVPASAFANPDADFIGAANAVSAAAAAGAQTQKTVAQIPAAAPAAPAAAPGESVVRDVTTTVAVELNAATVKCSAADYSMPTLKILVPALADLTILNHRNTREGAPCIAAGRCGGDLEPQNVLKSGEGTDQIPVRVILKKVSTIDGDVCHVALVETVSTTVRGVPFFHERTQEVADRAAADCR